MRGQLWTWIGANSSTLSALITLAGVVVAIVYVVLTRRLAAAAVRQAEETHRQADLTDRIAKETARQAQTSQQIFEAAHRAYLEVIVEAAHIFFVDPSFYRVVFDIKNHGPIPAVGISWIVHISRVGAPTFTRESETNRVIFPGEERTIRCEGTGYGAVVEPRDAIEIDVTVQYRSASGLVYQTQIVLQRPERRPEDLLQPQWRVLRHEMR